MSCHQANLQVPHLSKRPSDLKQNGTQEKTPFSGIVFHTTPWERTAVFASLFLIDIDTIYMLL